MANRKIGFYFLFLRQRDFEFPIKYNLIQLLNYLQERTRLERKQDIGGDKIVFLDSCTQEGDDNLLKLLFKNAKHSYRAPLINKNTVEERENPKKIDEGEQMKTHALVKFKDGDAILFLETGGGMLSYHGLAEYLNRMLALYNGQFTNDEGKILGHFCIDMVPRDDFREVLNSMNRVSCATIFTDKRILGSEALNYSEPSEELKEEVVIELKAKRGRNIMQHIYDCLDRANGANSEIRRIRVKGKLPNNNEGIIDTGFIIKKEYVDAQQNEDTGEYNTAYMFSQLVSLSRDY
nr:hypothetical protein [uncultured Prevotella sp.]